MLEEHVTVLYNVIYAQVYICCVSLPGCCQKTYKHRKETDWIFKHFIHYTQQTILDHFTSMIL